MTIKKLLAKYAFQVPETMFSHSKKNEKKELKDTYLN